ncbi:hypothetical protein MNV49_006629 [Pseudohyphozyma bogoriensis]|nr:hypothetical protein MNV49_006629 [Pseudohyphozyma bogoriensis]
MFNQVTLSPDVAAAYLLRIALPPALLDDPPSLELLSKLTLAHYEEVPKDTSPLHVKPEEWSKKQRIVLGSNFAGMPIGENPTFASLLRAFGFRCSEMAVNSILLEARGQDPRTSELGWQWGALTHTVIIVDFPGGEERYLVDVGYGGGGSAIPCPLRHGAQIPGLNPYEGPFTIRHEPLPLSPTAPQPVDAIPGWTFYRRQAPPGVAVSLPVTDSSQGYWMPLYHFQLHSISPRGMEQLHHYSAFHEKAAFTGFFLVTKLVPGTGGARRSIMYSKKDAEAGRTAAKVHTTGGLEAKGRTEGRDVEYVEMETGVMKEYLQRPPWNFMFS